MSSCNVLSSLSGMAVCNRHPGTEIQHCPSPPVVRLKGSPWLTWSRSRVDAQGLLLGEQTRAFGKPDWRDAWKKHSN